MKYISYNDIVNNAINEAMASMCFEDDMILPSNEKDAIAEEITNDKDVKVLMLKKEVNDGKRHMG